MGPTAEEMQDSLFKNTFKNKAANFPSILTIRTANIRLNVSILTSTRHSGLNKKIQACISQMTVALQKVMESQYPTDSNVQPSKSPAL